MTPQEALQWMHLLNYIIIIMFTTMCYCVWLIVYRAYKINKRLRAVEANMAQILATKAAALKRRDERIPTVREN